MAVPETWSRVAPYFSPDSKIDRWGDPSLLDDQVLLRLYDFRKFIDRPIFVTAGVKTEGHSPNSFHYIGNGCRAVDIVVPDYPKTAMDLILDALRFGFNGLGWYPEWQWKGRKCGGLHLDTRPLRWDPDETKNYRQSRWMGVPDKEGRQKYLPLTYSNIFAYLRS